MKKNILLLSAIWISISAIAQVKVNDELKNIINQSFTYFPKAKEAANLVDVAEQKLLFTQINNPTVDANASYNFVLPKIELPFTVNGEVKQIQFFPVNSYNANISASYVLFDFGRLKTQIEKSKTDLKYAQDNAENLKVQLAAQVSTIYYNILYIKKAIGIEDSAIAFLQQNKTLAESRFNKGDGLKIDALSLQSQIDQEQNNKEDLENNLEKQYSLLSYTSNKTAVTNASFDFDIPLSNTDAVYAEAASLNPEFKLAADKVEQSIKDRMIAKQADKPLVSLGGAAGIKNGYVPDVAQLRPNLAIGATLKIPLYSGGKTKQQDKIQQSLVKQNELAVESLQAQYKKDISLAVTDIETNLSKITNTLSQINNAEAQKKLASTRYINGVGTQIEISNAAVNLLRAQLTKLKYQYQLCLSNIELARLSGYSYWK